VRPVLAVRSGVLHELRMRAETRVAQWRPETGDAVLYGASGLFAAATAAFSTISLYRAWGELAVGPYLVAALLSAGLGRRRGSIPPQALPGPAQAHPWSTARTWLFLFVLIGATLFPLALEVAFRSDGNPSAHVQPEVVVIEQAGHRLALGEDPYHATVKDGHVQSAVPGEPSYESFFPYLPLMAVFGLPSSGGTPIRLTDARIFFSIVTLVVVAGALALCRGPTGRKVRVLQFLTVLPTAALPLATGGDDMPIVAFLLLAMVLAQRRRPWLSGLVLGVVSAMKFTAWPLAALALFAARRPDGRRAPVRMLLGMVAVAGPVVVPFVLRNPRAFFFNVVLFPLGLAGVPSPAASALPGHELVSFFPSIHRILPVVLVVVGSAVLVRHLVRHPPATAAQVTSLAGWVMLAAILFAPATRVGYLLYPIDFFVWSPLLRASDDQEQAPGLKAELATAGP